MLFFIKYSTLLICLRALSLIFFKIVWWINRRLCRRYMFCIPISHHSNWFVIFNRRSYMNIYIYQIFHAEPPAITNTNCVQCVCMCHVYTCVNWVKLCIVCTKYFVDFFRIQRVSPCAMNGLIQWVLRVLHMSATKQIFTRIENRATKSMHSLL